MSTCNLSTWEPIFGGFCLEFNWFRQALEKVGLESANSIVKTIGAESGGFFFCFFVSGVTGPLVFLSSLDEKLATP